MRILYPPRPETCIPPHQLSNYEGGEWLAQRKFNGTRNPIQITEDGQVNLFNRHGTTHKQFELTPDIADQILSLNLEKGLEYWLDSELLHRKTKNPAYKSRIVLYDVLCVGTYLFGKPDQEARLAILDKICGSPTKLEPNEGIALEITENVWMAQTWESQFVEHYEKFIHMDEIEGLVLRKRKSVIDSLGTSGNDVAKWILRVRKPHKNYNF